MLMRQYWNWNQLYNYFKNESLKQMKIQYNSMFSRFVYMILLLIFGSVFVSVHWDFPNHDTSHHAFGIIGKFSMNRGGTKFLTCGAKILNIKSFYHWKFNKIKSKFSRQLGHTFGIVGRPSMNRRC